MSGVTPRRKGTESTTGRMGTGMRVSGNSVSNMDRGLICSAMGMCIRGSIRRVNLMGRDSIHGVMVQFI